MSIVSTKLTNKTDFQITTVKSTSLFQFVVHFNVNFVKSLCGFKENHKVHATINSPLVQIKNLKKSHLPSATPDIFTSGLDTILYHSAYLTTPNPWEAFRRS